MRGLSMANLHGISTTEADRHQARDTKYKFPTSSPHTKHSTFLTSWERITQRKVVFRQQKRRRVDNCKTISDSSRKVKKYYKNCLVSNKYGRGKERMAAHSLSIWHPILTLFKTDGLLRWIYIHFVDKINYWISLI